MKLNISSPATGCQKLTEVDNKSKLPTFQEKHMLTRVAVDALGEEWKGFVVWISGGDDKQGFPLKQGALTHGCVHLLLSKGHSCYNPGGLEKERANLLGGCTVDANFSVVNLVIKK